MIQQPTETSQDSVVTAALLMVAAQEWEQPALCIHQLTDTRRQCSTYTHEILSSHLKHEMQSKRKF